MKIIFDSEEQKNQVVGFLKHDYCPSEFGFRDACDDDYTCYECWEKCGIEMEVKSDV